MKLIYLDAANSEFDDAISYYNKERDGLGFEFADEVKRTIERIENYPRAWTSLSKRARRCLVHRFPYSVIYEVRDDLLIIIAIHHNRRKPENWRNRFK